MCISVRTSVSTCLSTLLTKNISQMRLYHKDTRHDRLATIAKKALHQSNPYTDREAFLKKAHLASHAFPKTLRESLFSFKLHGNPQGYFLIRSLPNDAHLMDTPKDTREVPGSKKTFHSEFWLASIGSLLGEPFSYIQENHGNLFHNVRPKKGEEEALSSQSSKALLDLHTETAFHPFCPDFLLLYCLRSDRGKQAKTIVSSVNSIKGSLSKEFQSLLRQPLFKTGIDYSFGSANGTKGNGATIPILYGSEEDPLMIFDPDLMLGITEDAKEAIKVLKNLLDSKKEGVFLEAGDLLIVDNYRAVHGRNGFKAYYDGKDRWLQRIYVSRSLLRAQFLFGEKERIITYSFST